MTQLELFEHIRTLVRDALRDVGIGATQTYDDDTLITQVRAALRHILALGVTTDAAMSLTGTLSPEPIASIGVLIALRVVMTLLRGDMITRITSGEFGVLFSMGNDTIDTKTAAIQFKNSADSFEEDFRTLLTIILSGDIVKLDVYGGPLAPGRLN